MFGPSNGWKRSAPLPRWIGLTFCFACLLMPYGCDESPPRKVIEGEPWEITLTGADYNWSISDPGLDGELGNGDDLLTVLPMHLPERTKVRLNLRSRDFLYKVELPELKLNEIAIPDLSYALEFQTGEAREIKLKGDHFCGYAHPALSGTVLVESWTDYRRWQRQAGVDQPTPGDE